MTRLTAVATIRCEIDRSRADLAAPLLRSVLHHQCALVDSDVETVDSLVAAAEDVLTELGRRHTTISEITSSPEPALLDIRLELLDAVGRLRGETTDDIALTLSRGPVARAARLDIDVDDADRLRLVHRFDRSRP